MYTCDQEIVYDVSIFTNNPINQVITVTFVLNNKEILRLEYYAILSTPSLDRDYTDQWLQYQAEKENESLSGREIVSMKDKALSNMNLVVMTGVLCIASTTIAGIIVIVFKLISMINAFTGMMVFVSGFFWLDGMRKIDVSMRSIPTVTANDVFVYWSGMSILTLMFGFLLISYVIGYKIGKTRLKQWEFEGIDINNRTRTRYITVVQTIRGKYYWVIQNSWDAFKRVFLKKKHPIIFNQGDITDNFHVEFAKNIPENNDDHKEIRAMNKLFKSIYGKMAFTTVPKKDNPEPKKDNDNIERKYNFESWKIMQDNNPFAQEIPHIVLKGNPKPVDVYSEDDYKSIDEQLTEINKEAEKGIMEKSIDNIESAWKKFRLFKKNRPKPKDKALMIELGNANNYDMLHYANEIDFVKNLSDNLIDKDRKIHKLTIEKEIKSLQKGKEYYNEREKALKELRDRKERMDQNEPS